MTMRTMCEAIAKHWNEAHGEVVTGEQVFNYSPTGELAEIFFWYWETNHCISLKG